MKRQFSNRGEPLAELTAARSLANRKASIRTSFRIQPDRRTGSAVWLPVQETAGPPRKKQNPPNEKDTLVL